MAKSQQKFNVYQHVTDTILADLEAVTAPSRLPDLGRVAKQPDPQPPDVSR